MANDCLAQLQACALRVTRLLTDGSIKRSPVTSNLYVTDQMVMLQFQPVIASGVEWEVRNRANEVFDSGISRDVVKRLEVDLALCVPDPQLTELLAGGTVLTSGAAVGHARAALNTVAQPNGVSLEVWTKRIVGDDIDPTFPYAHWVLPRVYLQLGSRAFGNQVLGTQLSGYAVENANWGDGPVHDWPVASTKVVQWLPQSAGKLPTAVCGYQNTAA